MDVIGPSRLSRVKSLFGQALELPSDQRRRFIEASCPDDAELKGEIERLLAAHDAAGRFMDCPTMLPLEALAGGEQNPAPDESTLPFESIGPFHLIERLGEGGFGTVYLAEQQAPVRRRVALKILKQGLDSRQSLARFDAERQALAMMEHPHIARVYDAGTTPDRRPYFVMELVTGRPITEHCDRRHLDLGARLELFIDVCHAVHHAHQKGVIHRDIKPSNVIVSDLDGKATVKVIDFGVAKAILPDGHGATPMTEDRQIIGTPEYMSPEQAASGGADIDTRADVYSLGVLLYELLTGVTPFDGGELRRLSLAEMQQRICEVDPPRPSTRVAQTRIDLSATRAAEPSRLRSILRGDLDWIAMKCLEKDRGRRYESAAALAGDCRAFLDGRAVTARPATRMYRVSKFVRRNKLPVGAAAGIVVALIAGLIATSAALYQAKRERDRAVSAQAAADDARELAQQHVLFIEEMFSSIRPELARGREVTVREVLDAASARAAGAFRQRPLAEASVRSTFGSAYAGIGLLERGHSEFERAIGLLGSVGAQDDASWLHLRTNFGRVLTDLSRNEAAEDSLRQTLRLSVQKAGAGDGDSVFARGSLATLLIRLGRLDEAEQLLLENQALLRDADEPARRRLAVINSADLALLRHTQGRESDAETIYESAIKSGSALLGSDHPDVMSMRMRLGTVLRDQGDLKRAMELMSSVWEQARRVFGDDHPNTLIVAHQAALMLSANGRTPEAEAMLSDAIARARRTLGEDHMTTLFARHDLAQIWMLTRRFDLAEPEYLELIDRMTRVLGPNHRDTLMFRADLAVILTSRGDYAAVEAIYADILPRLETTMGADHPYTVSVRMRLGMAMMRQQRWTEAEPILERVYRIKKDDGSWERDWSGSTYYGLCLTGLDKHAQAVPILLEAVQAMRAYARMDRTSMRDVSAALAVCYERLGQPEQSDEYRRISQEMAASLATRPARGPATTTSAGN